MFSPPPAFEPLPGLVVEGALDGRASGARRDRLVGSELAEEVLRRDSARLLPSRRADGSIRGDDDDGLAASVVGSEAFEHVVRVVGEAHFERADRAVVPHAVEDDDAPRTGERDVTRQAVDELAAVPEASRVEDVVSVEEIEHCAKDARVGEEEAYLDELVRRLRALLGEELVGVYVGGSWALGGYEPRRSDLDVAAVVREGLGPGLAERIVAAVSQGSLPCPARKLELVVYSAAAARSTAVEAGFELNLNTGADGPLRVDTSVRRGEEHWFAIDRSVLAGHGVALFGPPAGEVFATPSRAALRPVLAAVLRWYRRNEPESDDGVLNAGRSLRFVEDGLWLPKPALHAWAREREGTKTDILDRAIAELDPDPDHD
jgi:hypothetical protein